MTGLVSTERNIFIKVLNCTSGSMDKIINLIDNVIVVAFGGIMTLQSSEGCIAVLNEDL